MDHRGGQDADGDFLTRVMAMVKTSLGTITLGTPIRAGGVSSQQKRVGTRRPLEHHQVCSSPCTAP